MTAGTPFWWDFVSAAQATMTYLGSKRFLLLAIEVFCAVVAFRAYRASQGKGRQWMFAMRDVFIVIFSISVAVFGYELIWSKPDQTRLQPFESIPFPLFHRDPTSFPLAPTNLFLRGRSSPICVQVLLPQGFSGGTYKLPFRPVAPSLPALYINGSPQRRGTDYTVFDSSIVVNFHPASKDSLSVWYTTDDPLARMLP
jgi:hypothetical protein